MEMEVMVPVPVSVLPPPPPAAAAAAAAAMDFNFDSTCSSPYMTAPSSPQRFGNLFFSAPTSPTRSSSFFRQFNNFDNDMHIHTRSSSAIPFVWEEKPGIPKNNDDNEDFAFDFSGQLERTSLSAEELFDGGKIKPLKPPPRLQYSSGGDEFELGFDDSVNSKSSVLSPRSRLAQGKKKFREALSSPRQKKDSDFDPFAAAIEETRKGGRTESNQHNSQRGRDRGSGSSSSSSNYVRKGTRSLSPLRVSDIAFGNEDNTQSTTSTVTTTTTTTKSSLASFLNSFSFSKGYRKWKLKDFLLFRSASEGRATGKDPLTKYVALSKRTVDDVKNSSFRSTESSGSVSNSRRRLPASAHELHYTVNRAVSEEMKRKTFLPYRQGLLGCLGFNPTVHEISRGLGI